MKRRLTVPPGFSVASALGPQHLQRRAAQHVAAIEQADAGGECRDQCGQAQQRQHRRSKTHLKHPERQRPRRQHRQQNAGQRGH